MMLDTIRSSIDGINAGNGLKVADWRLVQKSISRQEQYFVHEAMEQVRAVDEIQYSLTVYVDSENGGKKFRGEATVGIQPSHTRDEVDAKIRQAVFAASKSRNPWFELPGPAEAKVALPASGFEELGEALRMRSVRDALYAPETALAASGRAQSDSPAGAIVPRINSLELFVSREERRLLNSRGFDYSLTQWAGYSEFVVEANSKAGPVELFDDIHFSDPDPARLSETTGARLAQVRDRAVAQPMPALKDIPVILVGKEAEDVFAWFFDNSNTATIYSKASPFQVGMNIQRSSDDEAVADPIDLWAEPVIPGIPASYPFDADGFPLERTSVIEGGVLKTLVGSIRHADWLSVPRKGNFALFSVSPGTMSLDEMHAAPYLEPIMFSDFRLDSVTGDFGAEVRLAYYFDGVHRVPVTGGSISGSVAELRAGMRRSVECALASRSLCPRAVVLHGVSVTGL